MKIVAMLNPKAARSLPSDNTVSRDIKSIFALGRQNVKVFLQVRFHFIYCVHDLIYLLQGLSGAVHIALDGWSSPNVFAFLGIVVFFLDPEYVVTEAKEGEDTEPRRPPIKTLILDFVKLTKAHTGEYLAEELFKCLQRYGIELKVRKFLLMLFEII